MIESALSDIAMSHIEIGSLVKGVLNGEAYELEVTGKSDFALTLQGKTNKIIVPINTTDIYKEELNKMAPMPLPTGAGKGRGRPRKTGPAAPVEQQGNPAPQMGTQQPNTFLPPGSPLQTFPALPGQQGAVLMGSPHAVDQPQAGVDQEYMQGRQVGTQLPGAFVGAQHPAHEQVQQHPQGQPVYGTNGVAQIVPIAKAEGDSDWVATSVDEALDILRENLMAIFDNYEVPEPAAPAPPVQKTCAQCVNVDMKQGICALYKVIVPIYVVVNAETACKDFGFLDDEIPF